METLEQDKFVPFFFNPLSVVPIGSMEALDGWPPPVSSAGYIFFQVMPHFKERGSCCQQKLLAHITLQSCRELCYGSMWVMLGHSVVLPKISDWGSNTES